MVDKKKLHKLLQFLYNSNTSSETVDQLVKKSGIAKEELQNVYLEYLTQEEDVSFLVITGDGLRLYKITDKGKYNFLSKTYLKKESTTSPKSNKAQIILAICAVATLVITLIAMFNNFGNGSNASEKEFPQNEDGAIIKKLDEQQELINQQELRLHQLENFTEELQTQLPKLKSETIELQNGNDIILNDEGSFYSTKIELSEKTPIGVYKVDEEFSNKFTNIINETIKSIPDEKVELNVIGTADMLKFTDKIIYKGEFGVINSAYYSQKDNLVKKIFLEEGAFIVSNEQLAAVRAYSLYSNLINDKSISSKDIKLIVKTIEEINPEYRETKLELKFNLKPQFLER